MDPFRLVIPRDVWQEVLRQAQSELPNECCGLLHGLEDDPPGLVREHFPLRNQLASSVRYSAEPRDLIAAHRHRRQHRLRELAVYHSHPTSPPIPSRFDLADNGYGLTVVHLIISLETGVPQTRGWWLGETEFTEAEVVWLG